MANGDDTPSMGIGSITEVDASTVEACWYVDTGMYEVPAYGAAYLLDGPEPSLVETGIGTNYDRVLELLDHAEVDPADLAYICVTHVHLDHAGGAGFLAEACPHATVVVHERGARHLVDPERLIAGTKTAVREQWQFYVEPNPIPQDRIRPIADGETVDLGDRSLHAMELPGHASHQHAFVLPADEAVFTADAAGIYSPREDTLWPTSPPPEFDFDQCLDDIDHLQELDVETLLYTHFAPAPVDDRLERYRQVLTAWVEAVRDALESAPDEATAIERVVDAYAPVDLWGPTKARAETAMNARGVIGYLQG